MKLKALLSALLVMALLLSPVAMMEETSEPKLEDFERIFSEAVDDIVPEQSAELDKAGMDINGFSPVKEGETVPEAMEAQLAENSDESSTFAEGADDVVINSTNFPDDNFRKYILDNLDQTNDNGEKDSLLSPEEIKAVTDINLKGMNITSLKGIEHFSSLSKLNCSYNKLTEIDVSCCEGLTTLDCSSNLLASLDVSRCVGLTELNCLGSHLTALDVSACTRLTKLNCSFNNLTTLDVSACTELTELYCESCHLTDLDVSACTGLTILHCDFNSLTALDVNACTDLTELLQMAAFGGQQGRNSRPVRAIIGGQQAA